MKSNRSLTRGITVVAGGAALGFAAGRVLPPMMGSLTRRLRTRMSEDPFDKLIQDHRQIMATLDDMEYVPEERFASRGKLFLRLKRTLGKHALAEEDVVYPLLHNKAHRAQESKRLYGEHADMKIHLFELENKLKSNEDWTGNVRSLRELLQKHIRDEEEVEFPKLRQMLEGEVPEISGQIMREEAMLI